MIYGAEAVLPTDLDYGAPRIRAYDEQGAEASHQDAMDQLDKGRDVALLRLAKYQQALRRYHSRRVRDRAFNVGDLVLPSYRATKITTSSPHPRRGHTSSWKNSGQAPTS